MNSQHDCTALPPEARNREGCAAAVAYLTHPCAKRSIIPCPDYQALLSPHIQLIMAWWQGKFLHYGLRYVLSRTGFLDDKAIDPKDLDIKFGRQNVVELKDLGLNIGRISKLMQLPPSLRIETAKILSLRLTVPADFWQSSIMVEMDGVHLTARLDAGRLHKSEERDKSRSKSPASMRGPQHRKAHRRIPSASRHDSSNSLYSNEDINFPTTQDMARSFLREEPEQERRELEATVAAKSHELEESIISESSESEGVGMGTGAGLPGFLESFGQGIVDRCQVHLRNVEVKLETEIFGNGDETVPVTIRLGIVSAQADQVVEMQNMEHSGKRPIQLSGISLDLLSNASAFSQLYDMSPSSSYAENKQIHRYSATSQASTASPELQTSAAIAASLVRPSCDLADSLEKGPSFSFAENFVQSSGTAAVEDDLVNPMSGTCPASVQPENAELEIRPGDDNISWGSRRSKTSAPTEDLWNSMTSEDDLPDDLLIERTSTLCAFSTQSGSPTANKTLQDVSLHGHYSHNLGSWPRPAGSSKRHQLQHHAGSWPTLEQSEQNNFQPLTPSKHFPDDVSMDNMRHALETSLSHMESLKSAESSVPMHFQQRDQHTEDLTQSRMFSHADAESMYMSALSHNPRIDLPGDWGSEPAESECSEPPSNKHRAPGNGIDGSRRAFLPKSGVVLHASHGPPSGNATPRAQSPDLDRGFPTELASKKILSVDHVSIYLPTQSSSDSSEQRLSSLPQPQRQSSIHLGSKGLPGAFSTYSDTTVSPQQGTTSTYEESRSVLWAPKPPREGDGQSDSFAIAVGCIQCEIDLAAGKLLYRTIISAVSLLEDSSNSPEKAHSYQQNIASSSERYPVNMKIKCVQFSIMEQPHSGNGRGYDTSLIGIKMENTELNTVTGDINLRVGRFRTLLSGSELVTFDRGAALQSSSMMAESTPDIALLVSTNQFTVNRRAVTDISAETLPLRIEIDLSGIDDTLNSFGGLSGIIELGSSAWAEDSKLVSPGSTMKSMKGVRFQDDPRTEILGTEIKFTGRIGGSDVMLRGNGCAVRLRTSRIKCLYREYASSATVEHVILSGPHQSTVQVEPITVDLASIRADYLPTPTEKDLDRLLSLLTPSKDKYDDDDDILIDTLLRQRRHGALARVTIGEVKFNCANIDALKILGDLGGDLSKLSAVTKYLPDDERPGILTLLRLKVFEAQMPVNEHFGQVQITGQDLHCAHVGLPALLAFSLGNIRATRSEHGELVHALIPLVGADNLPMIMLRTLGNEAEPTIKLKLFNMCVEYSVPTIIALTGIGTTLDAEEYVTELAKSVSNLATRLGGDEAQPGPAANTTGTAIKRTTLEILIHDSAAGLTPARGRAKGLLVMNDGLFKTLLPPENEVTISLELRRAALFLTDDVHGPVVDSSQLRGSNLVYTTDARLAGALFRLGYISIGSFRRTIIAARIHGDEGSANTIEADFRSELLLLESCADSTQTMIEVLNGLAPPTPPGKQPKYLIQPMSVEDMMASFTGEPEVKQEMAHETIFDQDLAKDESENVLHESALKCGVDEVLMDSEMSGSLYGPVSGMFQGLDEPVDEESDPDEFEETVESLLEEDPFEMPTSPMNVNLSDSALMKELKKQCKVARSKESIELRAWEIETLGFDPLGAQQQSLGSACRFGNPSSRTQKLSTALSKQELPLRIRIRDTNFIWHIHDGYDWRKTRESIMQAVEEVELKVEERMARRQQAMQEKEDDESIIGDILFNSVYVGVPANVDPQDLRRQINRGIDDLVSETESIPVSGISHPTTYLASVRLPTLKGRRRLKLERSKAHKVSFELKDLCADVVGFPPGTGDIVNSIDVRIKDLEIFDNMPTSTWQKFVTRLQSDPKDREMSKPMVHIEILNVRTLQDFSASELAIHASVLPLRLHVDQDALDFIVRFFAFKNEGSTPPTDEIEEPFLQRLEVDTVDIRLDYKPKRIDYAGLRSGHTSEFMNFASLNNAPVKLRHTIVYGLRGFGPIHKTLNDIWMPDVTRNQLPPIIAGLSAVRELSNIGAGFKDVIAIPIKEYRKDGRLVRSIQKGAFHFGKTTASELARLGARIAIGTHNILQGTEELLSPASALPGQPGLGRKSSGEWQDDENGEQKVKRAISSYANQPIGLFPGLRSARRNLERDLLIAKDAFVAVQGEILDSSSPGAAARAVARHAPIVILRPVIGATRAVGTALLGVGNQIDRENLRRVEDKYKRT